MKTNQHTNLDYLKELSNGSKEFILQMINLFISTTPEMVRELENCLLESDWSKLRFTAHKMKPAISFMGIKELAESLVQLETYASTGINIDQYPAMIEKIRTIIPLAIEELEIEKKQFG